MPLRCVGVLGTVKASICWLSAVDADLGDERFSLGNTPGVVFWAEGLSECSGDHSDMRRVVGAAGAAPSSPPAHPQHGPVRLQRGLESLLLHGEAGARLGRELLLGMGTAETHEGNNNPTLKRVGLGDMDLTWPLV